MFCACAVFRILHFNQSLGVCNPQNSSFKLRFLQLGFADLLGQVVGVSPVQRRMFRSVLGPILLGPLMHSDGN